MKTDKRLLAVLLVSVGLTAVLIILGLRFDQHLSSVERQLLDRAPTAPPLQSLTGKPDRVAQSQTVYVPVYSHIYGGKGREQALEATLSIRNTDLEEPIVIHSIRYYGNEGNLLREYLEQPVLLGPLASTDFLVERRDMSGGVGANFLVDWTAGEVVTPPIIETIMVNSEGNRAFAFARSGVPIATSQAEESQ